VSEKYIVNIKEISHDKVVTEAIPEPLIILMALSNHQTHVLRIIACSRCYCKMPQERLFLSKINICYKCVLVNVVD